MKKLIILIIMISFFSCDYKVEKIDSNSVKVQQMLEDQSYTLLELKKRNAKLEQTIKLQREIIRLKKEELKLKRAEIRALNDIRRQLKFNKRSK